MGDDTEDNKIWRLANAISNLVLYDADVMRRCKLTDLLLEFAAEIKSGEVDG